jgi:signal transduction histidine kinase
MLATAGIAAGGIVSLAPAAWVGGLFVIFLLLPSVPLALSTPALAGRGIALLFLTFFVLMFFLWRRLHIEYWRALAGRAELVRAKEAAEAATLAKGQFIANVSHELRTPLTAIIGALGLVENDLPEGIPPHTMKLVDMAYQNGIRLSALINDILDFEKLNAGRMSFNNRRMSLVPCVERSLELNRSYADRYQVSFAFAAPPNEEVAVVADDQRLQQVMANLLSNAVKHSPAGGTVEVSVERQGNMARVAVRDHGAGIPEAFRPRIFEKFAQADGSSTRKTGGTGLGLAISKAIVTQTGGSMGFDSVTGQGATFYFDLPLAVAQPSSDSGR